MPVSLPHSGESDASPSSQPSKVDTYVPPPAPPPPPPIEAVKNVDIPPAPPRPAGVISGKGALMVKVPPAPPKPDTPGGAGKPGTPKSALAPPPPPAPPRPNLPAEYYTAPSPSTTTSTKRTESSVAESEFETEDEDGLAMSGSTRDTADSNASTKGSDTDSFAHKDAKAPALRADVAAFDGDTVGLAAFGLTGTRAKELAKERARLEDERRWEAVMQALATGELPA